MRVLIFHGYLLRGTGSNVYTAELAQALLRAGHDVDLLCQEVDAERFEWVDAVGRWDNTGALLVEQLGREHEPGRGRCTVFLPPIAGRLPVFVEDRYEHFSARAFERFEDDEIEFYIARNVMAVRQVVERNRPDWALANHMIMGPFVLAQALEGRIPYFVKIHGSAMEYTVRPQPRFLSYARSGVDGAALVLVGSRHIAERAWDTLRIPKLEQRMFLGPPGVDTERFRVLDDAAARVALGETAERILELPRDGWGPAQVAATGGLYDRVRTGAHGGSLEPQTVGTDIAAMQEVYTTDGIDVTAGDELRELSTVASEQIVLYVGKLIVSKGVDLALAAWPLVRIEHPEARLVLVGFGAYREGLEMLLSALSDGDLVTARWIAAGGRALEGGAAEPLSILTGFFDALDGERRERYLEGARGMRDSVLLTGRLEHDMLSGVIPSARCQLVPSTFPEAFGMVAAEAAACGVPPISAEHSGLAEVTRQLQERMSGVTASLLSFQTDEGAVERLASRIDRALALPADQRAELVARLREAAETHFSWDGVAAGLVAAAGGDRAALRRP